MRNDWWMPTTTEIRLECQACDGAGEVLDTGHVQGAGVARKCKGLGAFMVEQDLRHSQQRHECLACNGAGEVEQDLKHSQQKGEKFENEM